MTGCECADPVVFGHTSCPDGFWHSGETTCSPGCLPQHASPAIAAIAAIAEIIREQVRSGALAADLEQLQEPELIAGRKPLLNDCKACQASADGLRTVTPAMYCPGCRLPATGTIRVRSGQ